MPTGTKEKEAEKEAPKRAWEAPEAAVPASAAPSGSAKAAVAPSISISAPFGGGHVSGTRPQGRDTGFVRPTPGVPTELTPSARNAAAAQARAQAPAPSGAATPAPAPAPAPGPASSTPRAPAPSPAPAPAPLASAARDSAPAPAAAPAPAPEAPHLVTSGIEIPGVDAAKEHSDPFGAATVYENVAGALLQQAQRDDAETQSNQRFAAVHHHKVSADKGKFLALSKITDLKKQAKERTALRTRYSLKDDSGLGETIEGHLELAADQVDLVGRTSAASDSAVPLIDGTYEESRRIKKMLQASTGKRNRAHTEKRLGHYQQESQAGEKIAFIHPVTGEIVSYEDDSAEVAQTKHQDRLGAMDAGSAEVRVLGGHVRESKMSGDELKLKVIQFRDFRERMSKANLGGTGLGTKIANAVVGKGVGAVTGGLIRPETRTTDGAHSGGLDWRHGTIYHRIKTEWASLAELQSSAAFGSATGFHVGLQKFMLILREVRDFFAGLTIWLGLLSLAAPPVAAAAVVTGLVAVALSALRAAINTILLSWSTLQRATMSNWRAKDKVSAVAAKSGSELLSDGLQTVAPSLGAMAGSAAGASMLTTPGQLGAPDLGSMVSHTVGSQGLQIGQSVAAKSVGLATGSVLPGVAGMGVNIAAPHQDLSMKSTRDTADTGGRRVKPRRPQAPVGAEPEWMKDSRKTQAASTDKITEALAGRHAAKIAQFHAKTQLLITDTKAGKAKSEAARAKSGTEKAVDKDDFEGTFEETAGVMDILSEGGAKMMAVASRISVPTELLRDIAAGMAAAGPAMGMMMPMGMP